jgi:hypothetical protein
MLQLPLLLVRLWPLVELYQLQAVTLFIPLLPQVIQHSQLLRLVPLVTTHLKYCVLEVEVAQAVMTVPMALAVDQVL